MYEQCTLDDVRRALTFLDRADEREIWIKVGMAIKSEFGDEGFDAWDYWSEQAGNYNADSAKASWKSFKHSGGGIGIGTLFALAKEHGFEFERRELSEAEKQQQARERAERERQRKIDAEREAAEEAAWFERIALLAQSIWAELKPMGRSPYLGRKKVKSYGLRFFSGPLLLVERGDQVEVLTDWAEIKPIFDVPKEEREAQGTKIQFFKKGHAAVPLMDIDGKIWNLQVLSEKSKAFIRHGRKSGLFYWIGEPDPNKPLILVEGYSTGATIREATSIGEAYDCPVVVCFDCGNLMSVALQLRERYPDQHMVFAADDDAHLKVNDGVEKATAAAKVVGGSVIIPSLNEELEEAA
ncbi:PriCT-2 domain-containing protein [Microbulbifer sp. SAOS-129_SWC]|uniref:PriCT-2 domain-containing protein n=1 Tax=Microbulbifer sp. SAOS-129_SWC TaxID=3145235 RepID=UPI0032162A30